MAYKEQSEHESRLHVIHIVAEMAPVPKVHSCTLIPVFYSCWWDVVSGLGKALQKKGHLVEIVLLKYDCMQYDHVCNLRALTVPIESYFDHQLYKNKIWVGSISSIHSIRYFRLNSLSFSH
ncbi:probable starch synthase 4, chloroplastic/amyloplastic [Vigna radiata var. radiata]|uniref:starch synthase n=1 Tax=Vigna radiata var. radiata TaxID=3916 RepID=A0A3Q0F4G7_VIGRR|nr:probable starch synthase 4, chloroplastic/amyloplastic [Vigna radiata var. radiata]XP_022637303.1 probable starch synthase 4, chloroplastic/amyloplastic [Vigna radiata var. radiata]XP_022637304.1 probable starch synthase 4, chloroplastic/amyloplastic [Vigna radiata var. radiata]XP_022637305.1 probable starch synthase 4, chloroplastic/amyloplastic [Vigna radiata var. radiata]